MKSLVILTLALAGCFDSIVSDPCETGYHLSGQGCVASDIVGPGVDGPSDAAPDGTDPDGGHPDGPDPDGTIVTDGGTPDAPVCVADIETDPDNCGRCGHVCASGLCESGVCLGEPAGHVIALGHDYAHYHAGMVRVFGNALAFGHAPVVRVGWYQGQTGTLVDSGVRVAGVAGLVAVGRASTHATLTSPAQLAALDVIVVEPQPSVDVQGADLGAIVEAAGATWTTALHDWLVAGGVVIVLEAPNGASYRFAATAGLFAVGAPVDVSGQTATIVDLSDALGFGVPTPYAAETHSVTFPGAADPVVTVGGATLAFHRWVQ